MSDVKGHDFESLFGSQRGKINNRERAKQIVDFSGIRFENITPTDIDGLIEFHGKYWIWIELKHGDAEIPFGQRLAFERLADNLEKVGKPTIFIISSHEQDDPEKDIDCANSIVREYRSRNVWHTPQKQITTIELIKKFLEYHKEF